jgi:hypothetical protein
MNQMGLEKFNPRNTADVNAIADLHRLYLSDSMVVELGEPFLRDFYYGVLAEDGLVGAILCIVGKSLHTFCNPFEWALGTGFPFREGCSQLSVAQSTG